MGLKPILRRLAVRSMENVGGSTLSSDNMLSYTMAIVVFSPGQTFTTQSSLWQQTLNPFCTTLSEVGWAMAVEHQSCPMWNISSSRMYFMQLFAPRKLHLPATFPYLFYGVCSKVSYFSVYRAREQGLLSCAYLCTRLTTNTLGWCFRYTWFSYKLMILVEHYFLL